MWISCSIPPSSCYVEIDGLHRERKQLRDRFRAEQLAFSQQLKQQSEVERQRRDQNRAAREARRKNSKYR